jgi:hypothetical protein
MKTAVFPCFSPAAQFALKFRIPLISKDRVAFERGQSWTARVGD